MQLETGRFQRVDRILCTRNFKRLLKSRNRWASASFVVIVALQQDINTRSSDGKRKRLGVTVGRRVGNSVVRNRVKRHIREWFRHARAELPEGTDVVVIARRPARELSGCEAITVLDRLIDDPGAWENWSNDGQISTNHVGTRIGLQLLRFYQVSLSRLFGPVCRFEPSCSRYAAEAIEQFGLARGSWLAVQRLVRCHPLGGSGYDPVPGQVGDGP